MATVLKEIVVYAELATTERGGHCRRHALLEFVARSDAYIKIASHFRRRRQLPAIDLAIGQQRYRVEHDEMLRDHVVGQDFAQVRAQRRFVHGRVRGGDQIRQQACIAGADFTHGHDRVGNLGLADQMGFDLTWLDAVTAQLDLEIDPAQVFDRAVGEPATTIAGAIQPCIGRVGVRIGDEAFGRQLRPIEITQRNPRTTDPDLAGYAVRAELALLVEDPHRGVGDRASNDDAGARVLDLPERCIYRALGGPVAIPHLATARQQRLGYRQRQRFATRHRTEARMALPARLE